MGQYPTWTAGQRILAARLNAMVPVVVYKAGATTRAATTTLADDPDLTVPLTAGGVYVVEMTLHYSSGSTGKFTTSWDVPAGVSGNRSAVGLDSSVSNSTPMGSMRAGVHGYGTAVTYGDRAGTNQLTAQEESVLTMGSTSGNVTLMWAQSASNSTVTALGSQSWIRVQRIA